MSSAEATSTSTGTHCGGVSAVLQYVGFQTGFQNQISPVHQSKAPFGLDHWTGGLTSPPRTYFYMRRTSVDILLHAAYVAHLGAVLTKFCTEFRN
jgi:hypothetical protein